MNRTNIMTLLVALAGGGVFQLLHIPLAWMLGPMTSLLLWREAFGRKAEWPGRLRNAGLALLGYMMGGTFTAGVAIQIAAQLPSMAAATLATVGMALALGWITSLRTGISAASGLIGSIPGGLSQMVALTDEIKDADLTVVTFMQTVRLMAVIFIVPFLAVHGLASSGGADAAGVAVHAAGAAVVDTTGATAGSPVGAAVDAAGLWLTADAAWIVLAVGLMLWLAPRIHLPTPYMLGPMLATAVLCVSGMTAPKLPGLVIIMAQVMVGAHMGVNTSLSSLSNWRKLLPYAILGGVGIVVFSMGVGYVLTLWHPMSFATAFLGAAPGGMTEMGLTGALVHADLSIIVAYQMFRILFVLFIAPYIVKAALRRLEQRTAPGEANT
ncbi:AbrB family transcriptional regulator [Gorillibacterium sp. sgz5001074]|uniref:AbrB family transcriptional regulator n=1 Tax=Gorillibacterium sp. sgz5001074 TaxID=3446695 RepID=UPI003F662951